MSEPQRPEQKPPLILTNALIFSLTLAVAVVCVP